MDWLLIASVFLVFEALVALGGYAWGRLDGWWHGFNAARDN